MTQQTIGIGAAINDGTGDPLRTAFTKTNDNFTELYALAARTRFKWVSTLADLPAPSGGVITLTTGAYFFTDTVDLLGNRLLMSGVVSLIGSSSETSGIKSTGLVGAALITTTYSMPARNITLTAPSGATVISAVAASSSYALDWFGVNFLDSPSIGTISGYNNCVFSDGAFLNSAGLTFDGTIGTIAFGNYFFSLSAGTGITLPASLTVQRRFRINYSSFVATAGITGINCSSSATIPVDSYILEQVNFSGGGTYTAGVAYSDPKARFTRCKGISNSATLGYATMIANGTVTVIGSANTPVKAAGTFTLEGISQRFTLSSNKLVCNSTVVENYEISVNASLTTTANNVVAIYVAKNNAVVSNSASSATATAGGKAENMSTHAVLQLTTGDLVDVWVENQTASNNITAVNCQLIVRPVPVG